jgi:hypothetical protein
MVSQRAGAVGLAAVSQEGDLVGELVVVEQVRQLVAPHDVLASLPPTSPRNS